MSVYSGIVGAIYKESSTTHTFTDEASTLGADSRTVSINNTAKAGFKKDASLFTVKKNGSPVTSKYEICFDCVVFAADQTAGTWTISGTYSELENIGGTYEWGVDIKQSVQDDTSFGDAWESKVKGILGWSGSAKRHWIDEDYIAIVEAGAPLLFRFYVDTVSHDSFVGYGHVDGLKQGTKVDGITDGEISFSGDGRLYFTTI
jgi:hypothetical protein